MADFSKIKQTKKSRFGEAPMPEDNDNNLNAPETAPARKPRSKTGRTVAFATKVTAEFDEEFRRIAFDTLRFQTSSGVVHAVLSCILPDELSKVIIRQNLEQSGI